MSTTDHQGLYLIDLTEDHEPTKETEPVEVSIHAQEYRCRSAVTERTLAVDQDLGQTFVDLTKEKIQIITLRSTDWTIFRELHYPDDHTCIVCYRNFNDHRRRPIALNCGHSLSCLECILKSIAAKLGSCYDGGLILDDHVAIADDKTRVRAWLRTANGQDIRNFRSMYAAYQCPYRCRPKPIFTINQTVRSAYTVVLDAPNFTCLPRLKKLRVMVEQKNKDLGNE